MGSGIVHTCRYLFLWYWHWCHSRGTKVKNGLHIVIFGGVISRCCSVSVCMCSTHWSKNIFRSVVQPSVYFVPSHRSSTSFGEYLSQRGLSVRGDLVMGLFLFFCLISFVSFIAFWSVYIESNECFLKISTYYYVKPANQLCNRCGGKSSDWTAWLTGHLDFVRSFSSPLLWLVKLCQASFPLAETCD